MPKADGVFLTDNPQKLIIEGRMADIPFVSCEFRSYLSLAQLTDMDLQPTVKMKEPSSPSRLSTSRQYSSHSKPRRLFSVLTRLVDTGRTKRPRHTSRTTSFLTHPTLRLHACSSCTRRTPPQALHSEPETHLRSRLGSNAYQPFRATSSTTGHGASS